MVDLASGNLTLRYGKTSWLIDKSSKKWVIFCYAKSPGWTMIESWENHGIILMIVQLILEFDHHFMGIS